MTYVNAKLKTYAITTLFSAILLVLCACTGTPSEDKTVTKQSNLLKNQKPQHTPFTNDSVYDLLLAEFSLRRGVSDQAAQLYFDQAQQQQNRQLAEHAARLAHSLENNTLAIRASDLWLAFEPHSEEALSIKAVALINSNQDLASTYPLLEANASFKDTAIFTHLALNAKTQAQRWKLLNYFEKLEQQYPQSNNLLMAMAHLYRNTNNQVQAQNFMQRALKKDRGIEALLLNVDVSKGKNKARALSDLKKFLKKNENDAQVQEQALSVISQTDPEFALEVTNKLLEKNPQANLLLQLAKINIKLNKLRNADIILQNLLVSPGYKTQAHYLLGVIKRKQNLSRQAIPHFFLAQQDDFLIPATESLISILISLGEQQAAFAEFKNARAKTKTAGDKLHLFLLEASLYNQLGYQSQALRTLDTALIIAPNNTQLLYNRALINFAFNAHAAEQDLNKILSINANYAPALNALAYHYSQQKTQLKKAQQLIDRALQIDPHEPQYIDTKGWIAFQQSDYQQAQQLISQAYQTRNDPSIAAHLIEALWVQGKRQQSVDVWKSASIKFPDDPTITSTLKRLNINTRSLDLGEYIAASHPSEINSETHTALNTQQQLALELINQDPHALSQELLDQLSLAEQNAAQKIPLLSAVDAKNNLIDGAIKISNIENSNTQTSKNQDIASAQFAQNKKIQTITTDADNSTVSKSAPLKPNNIRTAPYDSTPYVRTLKAEHVIKSTPSKAQNKIAATPNTKMLNNVQTGMQTSMAEVSSSAPNKTVIKNLAKSLNLEHLNRVLHLDDSTTANSITSTKLQKLDSKEALMVLASNSSTSDKSAIEKPIAKAITLNTSKHQPKISKLASAQPVEAQTKSKTNTEMTIKANTQSLEVIEANKDALNKIVQPQAKAELKNLNAQLFVYNAAQTNKIDLQQPNEAKSTRNVALSSLELSHFTVQLIAMISDEGFADYTAQIPDSLEALKYKRNKDGLLWNVAIIGPFNNKEAARKAINQLPQSLRQYKPWIKSVRAVVAESLSQLTPVEQPQEVSDTPYTLQNMQQSVFNSDALINSSSQVCQAVDISHNNLLLSTLANNFFPNRGKNSSL